MEHNLVLGCYQMYDMWWENTAKEQCVFVGLNMVSEEIGSTLAFPLGDCTVGTSYVTHTACILCIIHHIHALATKLALLGKAMHMCSCGKCMWQKHTCLNYPFPRGSWGVNEASHSFAPITTKLHICRDGTRNQMWLPLNQWFARLLLQPVAVLICHRI